MKGRSKFADLAAKLLKKIAGDDFFDERSSIAKIIFGERFLFPKKGRIPPRGVPAFLSDSPLLFIKESDAWRIFYLAKGRETEVSLFMRAEEFYGGIMLSRIIVPVQKSSFYRTDPDQKWLADYWRSIPPEERKKIYGSSWEVWVHSHQPPNRCFWSGHDNIHIRKLMTDRTMLFSIVVGARENSLFYRCRLDFGKPIRLMIDNIPIIIREESDINHASIKAEMDREYESKVMVVNEKTREFPADLTDDDISEVVRGVYEDD